MLRSLLTTAALAAALLSSGVSLDAAPDAGRARDAAGSGTGAGSAAGSGTGSAAGPAQRWSWPISPPGAILRPFEAPAGPYAAGHRGIDIAAGPGEAVLAPAAGTVTFTGVVVDRPVVTIRLDDDVLVSLEPVTGELPLGGHAAAGQRLGAVAHGGHCDARCVHLGVRVAGEYVNPLLFLAGVPPAVLLPLE
ncbi:MAG TPA: peptidoglycan DD-metalloendopeptidase family protein [Gryllotalpicola sp.]